MYGGKHKYLYKKLRSEILEAQYWHIDPEITGLFKRTKIDAGGIKNVRLPHKRVAVEYSMAEDNIDIGANQEACHKRILLLDDIPLGPYHTPSLSVSLIYFRKSSKKWLPVPSIGIPWSLIDDVNSWFNEMPGKNLEWKVDYAQLFVSQNFNVMKDANQVMLELVEEIQFSLAFMQIAACSNVQTEILSTDVTGEPIRRPKKLIPYHKQYHKFLLSPQQKQYNKYTGDYEGTSKTAHWRKGHIRRQPTRAGTVLKWINPTFVGVGIANPLPVLVQA